MPEPTDRPFVRRPVLAATEHPPRDRAPGRPLTGLRRLASESLLAGDTEIEIEHGTAVYRLRLTSLGKLILTK
jgi:hemin uptake protein HemP